MAEGSMTWTEVADRLAEARTYWLGSTTASGAPHAAPVWGVVTGETLYLYSERNTVKARNLVHQAAGPAVPTGQRSRLRRGLGDPAAVGDGVAAGRLRRLAAPLVALMVREPPSTDRSLHGQRGVARPAAAAQGRLPGGPGAGGRHAAGPRPAGRGRLLFGGDGAGAGRRGPAPRDRRGRPPAVLG